MNRKRIVHCVPTWDLQQPPQRSVHPVPSRVHQHGARKHYMQEVSGELVCIWLGQRGVQQLPPRLHKQPRSLAVRAVWCFVHDFCRVDCRDLLLDGIEW